MAVDGRSWSGSDGDFRAGGSADSVARDIATRHGISPRRAASILDIFACVPQGLLPYGAQLLLASSLAAVSPLALATQVHYCWLLALVAVAFMAWPSRR